MTEPTVLITDYDYQSLAIEEEILSRYGVRLLKAHCRSPEEVIEAGKEAHILISQYTLISARVFAALPQVLGAIRYGKGYDSIDVESASSAGVWVVNLPDYCDEEVAEHAIGLVLCLNRKLCAMDRAVHEGRWDLSAFKPIRPLLGQTLGIVGLGRIGRVVGNKALDLGMRVLVYDPYLSDEAISGRGLRPVGLQELVAMSDFVTLHVPLTPETEHMMSLARFRQMKPTAYLINTSRGRLVDESALLRALDEGLIAGAALDVLEQEPPAPDNPLVRDHRVILTPHASWYSEASEERIHRIPAEEACRILSGREPVGAVNREAVRAARADRGWPKFISFP